MRVLITGAAGALGRVVAPGLVALGHEVVALDRVPQPDGTGLPWHTIDCADPDAVQAVFARWRHLDAVVHLAGNPTEESLPRSLTSHVVTTASVLDAMVSHDVRRIVFASSNNAVGRIRRSDLDGPLPVGVPPRPDTFHGVSKVAAEALLQLYADRYSLDAVACRVGSFVPEPRTVRHLSTWLSPGDAVRMVEAALTATAPGFALLYGISANSRAWWDLEPGRAIGYVPRDDAEAWADRVSPRPEDDFDAEFVGGPFATMPFHRPALDPT